MTPEMMVNGVSIHDIPYPLYDWYFVNSHRTDREENNMANKKLTGFDKVAVIEMGYPKKEYHYALYDNAKIGSKVLVSGCARNDILEIKNIITAEEAERQKDDRNKKYPLIEWGMTESDCLKYCREKGYQWVENGVDLYSILDRVSCWCCRNKNLKELKNIYYHLPDYWQMLRGLQSRIDEPFKGKGKSIFDLEKKFQKE